MEQKRLYKSDQNRMICGVCGGLGEYINVDPTIIRLLFAAFGIFGAGVLVYIAAAFIVPTKY